MSCFPRSVVYSLTSVKGCKLCYLPTLALAEHLPAALWHNEHANITTLGVCIPTTGPSLGMEAELQGCSTGEVTKACRAHGLKAVLGQIQRNQWDLCGSPLLGCPVAARDNWLCRALSPYFFHALRSKCRATPQDA